MPRMQPHLNMDVFAFKHLANNFGVVPRQLRVKVLLASPGKGWAVHDCLDVALLEVLGSMVRINGLFHLLINGVYWGYNSLTDPLISSWYIQVGGCQMKNQQEYTDEQKKSKIFLHDQQMSNWVGG